MGQLRERIRIFGTVLVLVLLASALVALALSSWLQGFFSRPITDLAETAKGVSQTHDYTLRAPKHAEDEVGVAVEAFNEMLARIEGALSERKRAEEALLALNTTLEERVAERTAAAEQKTAELQRSNQELEQFAYVASHDLQEPLRAVRSFTQLIEVRIRATLNPKRPSISATCSKRLPGCTLSSTTCSPTRAWGAQLSPEGQWISGPSSRQLWRIWAPASKNVTRASCSVLCRLLWAIASGWDN